MNIDAHQDILEELLNIFYTGSILVIVTSVQLVSIVHKTASNRLSQNRGVERDYDDN